MSAFFGIRNFFRRFAAWSFFHYLGLTRRVLFCCRFAAGFRCDFGGVWPFAGRVMPALRNSMFIRMTGQDRGSFFPSEENGRLCATTDVPKPSQSLASWWPKSRPKCGSDLVPVIFTGSSVPAPCLLKKGSTGFSRIDLKPVVR